MNIQTAMKMTAAETALIESYSAQVGELPGDAAVLTIRDGLIHDIRKQGLPNRRVEAWHYTDLRTLLRSVPAVDPAAFAERVAALVDGSLVMSVRNGRADVKGLPATLSIRPYHESLTDGTAAAGLAARGADDAVGRINGGFVRDGFEIEIADSTVLEQALELQVVQSVGQSHVRFPIRFGANSRATIIERHLSTDAGASLVSSITSLELGDGAEVTYVILQQQGDADTHLARLSFVLGAAARLRLLVVNAGGKLVRQEIHGVTAGADAHLMLRGINLLGGDSHTDVTFTLGHDVADTTSSEIIRNVLFDRARGVFQGQIRVAKDAQKTDAKMACNTLLLSDDADLSVKPELEIFADDVQCGHGATVADIDHTQLYYLMARGIPEARARALLVNAFVAEIVEEFEEEALVEALEEIISNWLENRA